MRTSPFGFAFLLLTAHALAGCDGGEQARQRDASQSATQALPAPNSDGSVTGAPDVAPGKGDDSAPSLGGDAEVTATPTPEVAGIVPGINPETGLAIDPDGDGPLTAPPAPDSGAAEPTAADAVTLVRDYYAAINARDYAQAHGLWADNGAASGQTAQQFAGGFTQTQGVSVEVGAPGAEDAGAGQRYIEVPVLLSASQADGSVKRFAGRYVLHRTVVDGASPDQRAWRIQSADLREVQP